MTRNSSIDPPESIQPPELGLLRKSRLARGQRLEDVAKDMAIDLSRVSRIEREIPPAIINYRALILSELESLSLTPKHSEFQSILPDHGLSFEVSAHESQILARLAAVLSTPGALAKLLSTLSAHPVLSEHDFLVLLDKFCKLLRMD